jgi:type IV pilus assembly protein PilY1
MLRVLMTSCLLLALFSVGGLNVFAAIDISDVPLDAQSNSAPALIMFVLDDSGSMDWEFMTSESSGVFSGNYHVFDNPGDDINYGTSTYMDDTERKMWKSQWADYNKMYYNPDSEYTHWPNLPDADPDTPRSHPYVSSPTFNLSSNYTQFTTGSIITVDNGDTGYTEVSGSWWNSGGWDPYGSSSRVTTDAGAQARWAATLPVTDNYELWVYWTTQSSWDRDSAARYVVTHSTGDTTYTVNQDNNYGQWNLLGSHDFSAGQAVVNLYRGSTDSGSSTNADAVRFIQSGSSTVNIPRAHYYTYSDTEARPYLIVVDGGSISYYAVTSLTGSGSTESVAFLTAITTPPADVVTGRSYTEERQNFANWYSFYRRRELTATAAISNVIANMSGVQIGITSINGRIDQPVMSINVDGVDETTSLLNALYGIVLQGNGTPLRRGLQDAGQYFHQNDSNNGGIGSCPYWSAADGGECQQAFAILMTDGYWNGDSPGVNNVDGDDGIPYADTYYNTLADVSMYYYENDLSSSLADLVPTNSADTADWQHMVTYGVSFGVTGTLDPDNYDLTASPLPTIPWTNPGSGNAQKIDDLYHASVNGRGTFLSAGDPQELVDSLLDIMLNIQDRIGSASSVSVNGDQLYMIVDDDTYLYQSSYDTTDWSGDINAYKVNSETGSIDELNPTWSVKDVWQSYADDFWDTRSVVTYNTNSSVGVPFRLSSLSTAQQALLDSDLTTAGNILEYVRGDQSLEVSNSGSYRDRSTLLGDLVHSSPVYQEGLLYAGANDGMLHVVVAEGSDAGKEVFAYVPGQVFSNLSYLVDQSYDHRYYVDLSVVIEENVTISSGNIDLLVGGLGKGGYGYYALDISDLNKTNYYNGSIAADETSLASRVLWEFPNQNTSVADIADIGYSFSEVTIARTNDSAHPWVIFVGNGYNSSDEQSVLFVLDPEDGSVLKKFELGAGADNGLASPAVTDTDGDLTADYVYAGDLQGNLWKVDVSSSDISTWAVAFSSGTAAPLFVATDPSGNRQPITTQPDIMEHSYELGHLVFFGTGKYLGLTDLSDTSIQTVYGVWDYGDDVDDSEYLGLFDQSTDQVSALSAFSTLQEQTTVLDSYFYDPDGDGDGEYLRVISDETLTWLTEADGSQMPNPASGTANNVGWHFDLPESGERLVSGVIVRDGTLIFISFIPQVAPCSPGGSSILQEVDAITGSRLSSPVIDINGDGVVDDDDVIWVDDGTGNLIAYVPSGVKRDGQLQKPAIIQLGDEEMKFMSSTAGSIETVREKSPRIGVSSWREY